MEISISIPFFVSTSVLNTFIDRLNLDQDRTYAEWLQVASDFCEACGAVLSEKVLGEKILVSSARERFLIARWGAGGLAQDYFTLLMFANKNDTNPLRSGLERFLKFQGDFDHFLISGGA
jgi:hypothetical protein